jgi:hypothetical protein
VPLAYVMRENVEIPPDTDPSEGYISVAEEVIARPPHGNQSYANDSMKVWSYMANITRAHDCWTYVKPAHRTKYGRRALSLTLDDSSLLQEMASHVHISEVNMSSLTADMRDGGGVDVATLEKNFGIGIEAAKRTRLVTTQRGVKRMINPSLSVRFRTNDRQLRYHRLHVTCFTDTLFSNSNSRQGNKSAQVFCTANVWTIAFPMAKEKDAHQAISLLFHRDGVPKVMEMDGAKAQIQGGF